MYIQVNHQIPFQKILCVYANGLGSKKVFFNDFCGHGFSNNWVFHCGPHLSLILFFQDHEDIVARSNLFFSEGPRVYKDNTFQGLLKSGDLFRPHIHGTPRPGYYRP